MQARGKDTAWATVEGVAAGLQEVGLPVTPSTMSSCQRCRALVGHARDTRPCEKPTRDAPARGSGVWYRSSYDKRLTRGATGAPLVSLSTTRLAAELRDAL